MAQDAAHLFMCLLTISIYSLLKYLLRSLAVFIQSVNNEIKLREQLVTFLGYKVLRVIRNKCICNNAICKGSKDKMKLVVMGVGIWMKQNNSYHRGIWACKPEGRIWDKFC